MMFGGEELRPTVRKLSPKGCLSIKRHSWRTCKRRWGDDRIWPDQSESNWFHS